MRSESAVLDWRRWDQWCLCLLEGAEGETPTLMLRGMAAT